MTTSESAGSRSGKAIQTALRSPQLAIRPGIEAVYGATVKALVAVIAELAAQITALQGEVEAGFGRHPDAEIYLSRDRLVRRRSPLPGRGRHRGGTGRSAAGLRAMRSDRGPGGTLYVELDGLGVTWMPGNRRINRVLHIMAIVQLRHDTDGRACYRRKIAAGKTSMAAMRCLKRRLSDAVYRQMLVDAAAANAAHQDATPPTTGAQGRGLT
jgi:hypothetical protein